MPVDDISDHLQDPTPEFSFPVDVTSLTLTGRSYTLKATPEERARVAARLDLQDVSEFTATLDAKFVGSGMFKVTGEIKAKVVQTCVVSLGAVPATIRDEVSATFITHDSFEKEKARREKIKARAKARGIDEDEDVVELGGDDPPEVAKGDRIDLGEVAVVHLALALDPYPRAPGATFSPPPGVGVAAEDDEPAVANPFAALAQFKKGKKSGPEGRDS